MAELTPQLQERVQKCWTWHLSSRWRRSGPCAETLCLALRSGECKAAENLAPAPSPTAKTPKKQPGALPLQQSLDSRAWAPTSPFFNQRILSFASEPNSVSIAHQPGGPLLEPSWKLSITVLAQLAGYLWGGGMPPLLFLTLYTKINSICIINLYIRPVTIKLTDSTRK